ncbi:UNVERIFIED_CONTAM: hypothetical protein Slati_2411000 [Sesamum latifolium]|uniref:Uncharacterized protein n=1 Tax=Sesamum latifolium TaxID=2727402 RepID=A0AAW2WDB9_9LAMI
MDKEGSLPARRSRDSRLPDTRSLVSGLWSGCWVTGYQVAGYQGWIPGHWFRSLDTRSLDTGSLDTRSQVPGRWLSDQ